MMEEIHSSKALDLMRATWRHIPEDGILHSHRHENLKSYKENFAKQQAILVEISTNDVKLHCKL
jgi:hypothetical protein